jgi:WXG100 family type VII secretion target
MAAPKVAVDYEDIDRVCQMFIRESDETEATIRILRQAVEELRGGGWIGVAGDAFYDEMDNQAFPFLQNLVKGLQGAEQQVRQAIAKLHDTEDSNAGKFKALQAQLQTYTRE